MRLRCRLGFHKRPEENQVSLYVSSGGVRIPFEQVPERTWRGGFKIVTVFRCASCGKQVVR